MIIFKGVLSSSLFFILYFIEEIFCSILGGQIVVDQLWISLVSCVKPEKNSVFLKNGKTVILV